LNNPLLLSTKTVKNGGLSIKFRDSCCRILNQRSPIQVGAHASAVSTVCGDQHTKERKMNSIAKCFAGTAVLLTAMLASAQHLDHARVTVPFLFNAGSQVLPAGEYEVTINDGNDVVTLSREGRVRGMLLGTRGGAEADSRSYLRFRQQAGQWFLQNVAVAGITEQLTLRHVDQERVAEVVVSKEVLVVASRF
jgi:hypothetical protein